MNKRDLVIVALATFCLTSTLFMILPSRSAERDPWADVSGPTQGVPDGTINMRDINYEIQHFNQDVSNMTRTVNALDATCLYNPPGQYVNAHESWMSDDSGRDLNATGFREFTVDIYANGTFDLYVHQLLCGPNGATFVQYEHAIVSYAFHETYTIVGNALRFILYNTENDARYMSIFVYMHSIPSPQSQPKDKTIWVGDYLFTMNNSGSGGWLRYGEYPAHVGEYEKMTVIFKFPDGLSYIDERTIYVSPSLQWGLDSYYYNGPYENPTTTLYQIKGGQYTSEYQISTDSYPIREPYVKVGPSLSGNWESQIGNLTVSVYLYLSNGPIASSTRKTMQWGEWRDGNLTSVNMGGLNLQGFTKLTVTLFSNVTWTGQISWGNYPRYEPITLNPYSGFSKTYELEGDASVFIQLSYSSATPSYVSASFSVIA